MTQIGEVIKGLNLAVRYGATTVEAEHDEIFFTLTEVPDRRAQSSLQAWGWELATDEPDPDEPTDLLWWRRDV